MNVVSPKYLGKHHHPKAHRDSVGMAGRFASSPQVESFIGSSCSLICLRFLSTESTDVRTAHHASPETSLREVLFQIIKFVNEKKDHIPPVPSLDCVSFPYEIALPR